MLVINYKSEYSCEVRLHLNIFRQKQFYKFKRTSRRLQLISAYAYLNRESILNVWVSSFCISFWSSALQISIMHYHTIKQRATAAICAATSNISSTQCGLMLYTYLNGVILLAVIFIKLNATVVSFISDWNSSLTMISIEILNTME